MTKRSRDEADAAADLSDEVRDYIARLTSEKNDEGKQQDMGRRNDLFQGNY